MEIACIKNIFTLKDDVSIIIDMKKSKDLMCCHSLPVYFCFKGNRYRIDWIDLLTDMNGLKTLLKIALNAELFLPSTMTHDIGFMYNEFCAGRIIASHWIGENYLLWKNDYVVWIYNDLKKDIILEITPLYQGHFMVDPNESKTIEPYEQWIQSYEPLFKGILSREKACEWVKQAGDIIDVIDANTASMQKAGCGGC